MGSLGTEKVKDILITKLDDEVLEVRLAAAEQLGRLGIRSGEPHVLKVLAEPLPKNPQETIRRKIMVCMAVGEIGTESLSEQLPKFLDDPSKMVRLSAAKAVYRQGMN